MNGRPAGVATLPPPRGPARDVCATSAALELYAAAGPGAFEGRHCPCGHARPEGGLVPAGGAGGGGPGGGEGCCRGPALPHHFGRRWPGGCSAQP